MSPETSRPVPYAESATPTIELDHELVKRALEDGFEESTDFFARLEEEPQQQWSALIQEKLSNGSGFERLPQESQEMLVRCFEEIVGRGNITPELFDLMLDRVVIHDEDRKAANDNDYISGAVPTHGEIHIFPKFFRGPDAENEFVPEHVIAHELGELAFGLRDRDGNQLFVLRDYLQYRLPEEHAVNGKYVDSWEDEEVRQREEFAESFADFLRSQTGGEMLVRRFQRVNDWEVIQTRFRDESTRAHVNALLTESQSLHAFFMRGIQENHEQIKQLLEGKKDGQSSETSELDQLFLDQSLSNGLFSTQHEANLMAPKSATKKPQGFLSWLAGVIFGN
jgi:hypothetical protein